MKQRFVFAIVAAFISLSVNIAHAEDPIFVEMGSIGGGNGTFTIHGNYIYAIMGVKFTVIDINEPTHPKRISTLTLPSLGPIQIIDEYAYVAGEEIYIIDISNPYYPIKMATYSLKENEDINALIIADNRAYLAGSASLIILDITNRTSPIRIGEFPRPPDTDYEFGSLIMVENYVYIEADHVKVIDVSDPSNPIERFSFETILPGTISDFAIEDEHLYISSNGFHIMDISDPVNPQKVGFTNNKSSRIAISDNYAYLYGTSMLNATLTILDVSDRVQPDEISQQPGSDWVSEASISGYYLYSTHFYSGLRVVDISDPERANQVGFYRNEPTSPEDLVVVGDTAIVIDQFGATWLIDVSDITLPVFIGAFPVLGQILARDGNHLFMMVDEFPDNDRFSILDISNPLEVVEIGFYKADWYATDMTLFGNYAYVAAHVDGVRILDISNLADPKEVGHYIGVDKILATSSDSIAYGMKFSCGEYGTVCTDQLHILDTSNPAAPNEIATFPLPSYAESIHLVGNYAFITTYEHGLRVLDISNPTQPIEVETFTEADDITDIEIVGNSLFLSALNGFWILDISDPTNLIEQKAVSTYDMRGNIEIDGAEIYLVAPNSGKGLSIFKYLNDPIPTYLPILLSN